MLANAELAKDFSVLNQQMKELVRDLVDIVDAQPVRVEVESTPAGNFRGFDGGKFYVVDSGSITARYQGRAIFILEERDMLLPDIGGSGEHNLSVMYGSEAGATLYSYSALEFMQRVFSEPAGVKLWTRMLITYSGMMLRLTAAQTRLETSSNPGFELFEPGDVIIHQGERADYVFNMMSGVADVLVNNVIVGRIGEGEIFGAMAALTHADRSATVRAKTACSVVKVPKEQFIDLIKSNPATIHSLIVDMANSIVNLNDRLVGLRSDTDPG